MNKGDIVLIPFPFTDLSGNKNRPALILVDSEDDVTVCFITTQQKWKSAFDIPIQPSPVNGIKKPSIIRLSRIATIDKELILGKLGLLDDHFLKLLNSNLVRLFKLDLSEIQELISFFLTFTLLLQVRNIGMRDPLQCALQSTIRESISGSMTGIRLFLR